MVNELTIITTILPHFCHFMTLQQTEPFNTEHKLSVNALRYVT